MAWACSGNALTSSRNTVPPAECMKFPVPEASPIAPQLTVTKGSAVLALSPWMARAIPALPTPGSPSISTGLLAAAARRPSAATRSMLSLPAMRSAKPNRSTVSSRGRHWMGPSSAAGVRVDMVQASLVTQKLETGCGPLAFHGRFTGKRSCPEGLELWPKVGAGVKG